MRNFTLELETIAALANQYDDKVLILTYKADNGDTLSGECVQVYKSLSGKDCININNFANVITPNQVVDYHFEDI